MNVTLSIAQTGLQRASADLMSASQRIASVPADAPTEPERNRAEASQDLTQAVLDLSRAKTLYNANAAMVRVASDVSGTLLNILERDGR